VSTVAPDSTTLRGTRRGRSRLPEVRSTGVRCAPNTTSSEGLRGALAPVIRDRQRLGAQPPAAADALQPTLRCGFQAQLSRSVRLAGCEGVVLLAPPQDHDKMSDQAEDWHERPTE
jgi:hypothetical protein